MRRPLALLGATLLAFTLTAASCGQKTDVTLTQVGLATVSEEVEAPASITARAAVALTAPANGTLVSLAVEPGATVQKGQTLAVVDSPEAQTRLDQATQALQAAKRAGATGGTRVNLGGAQQKLDAAAKQAFAEARDAAGTIADPALKDKALAGITAAESQYNSVSQGTWQIIHSVEKGISSLAQGLSALGAAQAMQAQQAYDLAKSTVDSLTIKAPIAGVVQLGGTASSAPSASDLTSLIGGLGVSAPTTGSGTPTGVSTTVSVGTPVKAGTAIVTIVDLTELGIVADVDETDVLLVKPGIGADIELDAAPGAKLTGKVTAIDVLPTANSRGAVAYKVHLLLDPSDITPRPGMSALVRLKVREATNAVTVPAAAVFNSDGTDVVWVRGADNLAHKRKVKIGVSGRDLLQITDGLAQGDWVVSRGTDKVTEGGKLP